MLQKLNLNIKKEKGKENLKKANIEQVLAFDYYSPQRIYLNGNKGTLYTLSNPSKEFSKAKELEENHSNILVLNGHSQYAKEIKKVYIFISDKKLVLED